VPIPTDQRFVPLLVPQRFDGIEIRGLLRGIKAEEDADGAGEDEGNGDNDPAGGSSLLLAFSDGRGILRFRGMWGSVCGISRNIYINLLVSRKCSRVFA